MVVGLGLGSIGLTMMYLFQEEGLQPADSHSRNIKVPAILLTIAAAAGFYFLAQEVSFVSPAFLSSSLKACISQRLMRKLCQTCKKAGDATPAERKVLGVAEGTPLQIYSAVGCKACHGIGYSGRFAAIEILIVNDELVEQNT